MDNKIEDDAPGFVKMFVVPAVVALVIGAGSTWFTAQIAIATLETRINSQAKAIAKIEAKIEAKTDQATANEALRRRSELEVVERLARIETQIENLRQENRRRAD